jgi:hypothetical protein
MTVESTEELTVFVKSRACDTAGVIVSIVFADRIPGEKYILTKSVEFRDCNLSTRKLSFETDGRRVAEVRVLETAGKESHRIVP